MLKIFSVPPFYSIRLSGSCQSDSWSRRLRHCGLADVAGGGNKAAAVMKHGDEFLVSRCPESASPSRRVSSISFMFLAFPVHGSFIIYSYDCPSIRSPCSVGKRETRSSSPSCLSSVWSCVTSSRTAGNRCDRPTSLVIRLLTRLRSGHRLWAFLLHMYHRSQRFRQIQLDGRHLIRPRCQVKPAPQ